MIMDDRELIAFDMDGTLCDSQEVVPEELARFLMTFPKPIVIVSGATRAQMEKQIPFTVPLLGQNGNEFFERSISDTAKERVLEHIHKLIDFQALRVRDISDLIQDRAYQISYSCLGHNADRVKKRAFDPDGTKRRALLSIHPFEDPEIEVVVGGTTCFDYSPRGGSKGENLRRYMRENGFTRFAYYGDQLYRGGNDESVLQEQTIQDRIEQSGGWKHTLELLHRDYGNS